MFNGLKILFNKKRKWLNQENITKLIMPPDQFIAIIEKRIKIGEDILNQYSEITLDTTDAINKYEDWNKYNSELLKQSFNLPDNEYKNEYDQINSILGIIIYNEITNEKLKIRLARKITGLKELRTRVPILPVENHTLTNNKNGKGEFNPNQIFIVHGHNNEVKITVARTLEKLGITPIILQEQANNGKTVIEKFEEYSNVGYAIVLLTNDDLGRSVQEEELKFRARQNVIFELGYFIGKLGRNRVCSINTKNIELPSDIFGLMNIEIDNGGSWKFSLAKELKSAEFNIDYSKII